MRQEFADRGRPLTVSQFVDFVNKGVFSDVRVEMLDGMVVKIPPLMPFVVMVISILNQEIGALVSDTVRLRTRMLFTADRSVPAPDIYLYRGPIHRFRDRFPSAEDMLVGMEVAHYSTLSKCRGPKAGIYARNTIPEYWIVNCVDRQIEIYTEPTSTDGTPRYASKAVLHSQEIATLQIEGQPPVEIPLAMLFGE